ncbi:MAG: CHAP domain-containing protein [Candidatus Omnitrophota bacterium]
MKIKMFVKVLLCSVIFAMLFFTANISSTSKISSSPSGDYQTFNLEEFNFSFMHPSDWIVNEITQTGSDKPLRNIMVEGTSHEILSIKIYNKPENVEDFIKFNVGSYAASQVTDLVSVKSTISGCEGYSWIAKADGIPIGGTTVFGNDQYLFVLNFTGTNDSDILKISDLIQTVSLGIYGPTQLTFDPASIDYPFAPVSGCCPDYNDKNNLYSCSCARGAGNPAWCCEYRYKSGETNFPSYGLPFQWIYKSFKNNEITYPVGGTIPIEKAIVVFKKYKICADGHVAYITKVNNDGSIIVEEQLCGAGCKINSKTYLAADLRDNLAGYIYADKEPIIQPKIIPANFIGSETVVDDYNFSNKYNFQAHGPGYNYDTKVPDAYGWGISKEGYNNYFHYLVRNNKSYKSEPLDDSYSPQNNGEWRFQINNEGEYEIFAYIPKEHATDQASYYLDNSECIGTINQKNQNAWVRIGSIGLLKGLHSLNLLPSNVSGAKELAFDAIKIKLKRTGRVYQRVKELK